MHIAQLVVYPIKSCGGLSLPRAALDGFGLANDRRFMLVDAAGHFVSQRSRPRLALVRPRMDDRWLVLTARGAPELAIPLHPTGGAAERVEVWGDWCDAQRVDPRADAWFADRLGEPVRLVHMPPHSFRQADLTYARPGERVSFADGFPLLLTSTASLEALNARLATPVPMDRFRPNVVVAGAGAFEEDRWLRVRAGGVVLRVVKPCARCVITTVDQATGESSREPLRTLGTFRRGAGGALFGQNLVHEGVGELAVGGALEIIEATPG